MSGSDNPGEKLATRENLAKVAVGAAKGASKGGWAGAAAGAAQEGLKVATANPKVRRRVVKILAGVVAVIAVLAVLTVSAIESVMNASSSTQAAGIRQRADRQAVDAGLDTSQLGFVIDQADRYGIPWEIAAATFWTQQNATGGVGPWHITAEAAGQTNADNFTDSTMWVLARMNSALAAEPTLDRRLGLGDGSHISESGQVTWDSEQARDDRLVTPYGKALATLPLDGASEDWGKTIATAAIYWHAGQAAPCGMTGANYGAMAGVVAGAWTQPAVDADGTVGAAGKFGPRINPVTGLASFHYGFDLNNVEGTPIWAAADGTVTDAGPLTAAGGNTVIIDHGGGIQTYYEHMQPNFTVQKGQQVKAGQQIGQIGLSGWTTGAHLHFETHVAGKAVDPYEFMKQRGIDLLASPEKNAAAVKAAQGSGASTQQVAATTGTTSGGGQVPSDASGAATSTSNPSALTSKDSSGQVWNLDKTQIDNAALIIGVGKSLNADPKVIQAALATALVESNLKQLASRAVPESLTYPNDGVAAGDHDSVGMFQQRALQGTWGTVAQIMDKTYTTQMFYGGPTKPNKSGPPGALDVIAAKPELLNDPGRLAQAVQVSAFPDRYAVMLPVASDLMAAVSGILVPGGAAACNNGAVNGGGAPFLGNNLPKSDRNVGSTAHLQPVTLAGEQVVAAQFPQITEIGGWRPSDAINPDGHPAGLAIDVMIPGWDTPAGKALGDQVAAFVQANYKAMGVEYIIWRQHIWNPSRASEGWRQMADRGSATENHMDHVHINFNKN